MVVMNTVDLQAFSTNDKLESFDIIRIGARYELRKVTCQDQAHSFDATCGALCVTIHQSGEHQHAPRSR